MCIETIFEFEISEAALNISPKFLIRNITFNILLFFEFLL